MIIVVILVCLVLLVLFASDSQIQSESNKAWGLPSPYDHPPPSALSTGAPTGFYDLPDDFSFSLSWNINGHGSYDSAKGILTWGAGGEQRRELILSNEKKRAIREILLQLNLSDYPDAARPEVCSPGELILTIRCGRAEKTVGCTGGSRAGNSRLASACYAIIGIITSSEEEGALLA